MSEIHDLVIDGTREIRRVLKSKRFKRGKGRPRRRMRSRVKKLREEREQSGRLFQRRHLIVTK